MIHRALIPLLLCVAGAATAPQKSPPTSRAPTTVTVLPGVKITEAVPAAGTTHVYYTTYNNELFVYDRANRSSTLIGRGMMSEIALSPRNDRIAFGRGSENNARDLHIWTMPLDPVTGAATGPARRVSVVAGHAPSFSPDGERIAFASMDSAGKEFVTVMPASGGDERIADRTARSIELIRWSPDARTLYVGDWGNKGDRTAAYHVPTAGGAATLIGRTGSSYPGPSPDGRFIATIDARYDSLFVTADGKRIASLPYVTNSDAATWVGNDRLFTWRGPPRHLRILDLASGAARTVLDSTTSVRGAAWSPDGRRIAFMAEHGLEVVNVDGSGMRTLGIDMALPDCGWSPDGRWVLGARWVDQNRWDLIAAEVTGQRRVTLARKVPYPGIIFNQGTARWAPDSRSLFYARYLGAVPSPGRGWRWELHEASLAGTDRVLREMVQYRGTSVTPLIFGDTVLEASSPGNGYAVVPIRSGKPGAVVVPDTPEGRSFPSFSPDGRRVAYRINPAGNSNAVWSQLEVMNIDGTKRTRLNLPFNAATGLHNPMFPADPKTLLVAGQEKRDGDITLYLMSLSGEVRQKVAVVPLNSAGRNDFGYDLSTDGRKLLYTTYDPPYSSFVEVDLSGYLKPSPARKRP